jgi:hypothetical protein
MARRALHLISLFNCSDDDVRRFCESELSNFNPYADPQLMKSARQLLAACRDRFGDPRCVDLEFWEH